MYESIDQILPLPTSAPMAVPVLDGPLFMPPDPGGDVGEPAGSDITVIGVRLTEDWAVYSFNLFMIEAGIYSNVDLSYDFAPGGLSMYGPQYDPDHVDNSALDPTGKFDLSDTREIYKFVGGNQITVVIDNKSNVTEADISKVLTALDRLNSGFSNITLEAQAAIAAMDNIVISVEPERSYAEVETNSYFLDFDQLSNGNTTIAFTASIILHDAGHILQHDLNPSYVAYSGDIGEAFSYDLEYHNRSVTGLSDHEVATLQRYRDDPSLDDEWTSKSPYPGE